MPTPTARSQRRATMDDDQYLHGYFDLVSNFFARSNSVRLDDECRVVTPRRRHLLHVLGGNFHWKCFSLTLLVAVSVAALVWCKVATVSRAVVDVRQYPVTQYLSSSVCEPGYEAIPLIFMLIFHLTYLLECYYCSTRTLGERGATSEQAEALVRRARQARPVVWWRATAYHYVQKTRSGRSHAGAHTYYERVVSRRMRGGYNYAAAGFVDLTPALLQLHRFPATLLRLSTDFSFSNQQSQAEFEQQKLNYFYQHEFLDDHVEFTEGLSLVGCLLPQQMVVVASESGSAWFLQQWAFWAFSVALLSWPYRLFVYSRIAYADVVVHKRFGCAYDAQLAPPPADSFDDLTELRIANNCSRAPSYAHVVALHDDPTSPACQLPADANLDPNLNSSPNPQPHPHPHPHPNSHPNPHLGLNPNLKAPKPSGLMPAPLLRFARSRPRLAKSLTEHVIYNKGASEASVQYLTSPDSEVPLRLEPLCGGRSALDYRLSPPPYESVVRYLSASGRSNRLETEL